MQASHIIYSSVLSKLSEQECNPCGNLNYKVRKRGGGETTHSLNLTNSSVIVIIVLPLVKFQYEFSILIKRNLKSGQLF